MRQIIGGARIAGKAGVRKAPFSIKRLRPNIHTRAS